jgi:rSAM/selenodomain-associated transferase 1
MDTQGCICIFAKAPRPGEVKTRLIPALGSDGATALATAFLQDTIESIASLPWAKAVIATTEYLDSSIVSSPGELWLQGEGNLGVRLERIFCRALTGSSIAIAIGADSPGLPRTFLEQARSALQKVDAVVGPCEDGGFYLLGLRRCPSGVFDGILWSDSDTFTRTLANLQRAGLTVQVLEPWFDVDRPEDLARLRALIATGRIHSPKTCEVLAQLLS